MQDQDTWLIVGLGNPGEKYRNSRHNCGWMALDRLAGQEQIPINRIKFKGLYGTGRIRGVKVILLKPTTFMNLSGESIRAAADYFHIPNPRILVLYDDLDVDCGLVRIREKGGPGTHNGMRSAVRLLGGQDFPRIRIGIGPKPPETDLTDFVLGQIPPESAALMNEAFERCCEGVRLTLERDIQFAMNRINPHRLPEQSTPQAPAASIRPKEGDV